MVQAFWKNLCQFVIMLKGHLPYNQSITYIYLCEVKDVHSPNNLYANICDSFVWNQQKLKTGQLCFNCETNKQNVLHPYSGIQLWNTSEQLNNTRNDLKESQIGKKNNKKALYCMIQFSWLSYKHKTIETENKSMAILGKHCL